MISPIEGWSWEMVGEQVHLAPMVDSAAGFVAYAERRRPLRGVADLVAERCGGAALEIDELDPIESMVTEEGEHAAIVSMRGRLDGVAAQRTLGFVLADDFYACVDGWALRSDGFERFAQTVRRLVATDTHMLGVRRRRFRFATPAGYHLTRAGLFHAHLVPALAAAPSAITVFPALPLHAGAVVDQLLRSAAADGGEHVDTTTSWPVVTAAGLCGAAHEVVVRGHGAPVVRRTVILEDDRYAYAARLDCAGGGEGAGTGAFDDLVHSIEPIPRPRGAARLAASEVMSAWAA